MKRIHTLTAAQQDFAEEHIGLVYRFLQEHRLPADEYYDIIIFGYLSAVQDYDEKPDLSQYSFATIAWQRMRNSVCEHRIYQNRPKRKPEALLYEQELDQLLPDRRKDLHDMMAERFYALELMSYLTQKEKEVVLLKADGLAYQEIANRCGIAPSGVSSRFKRMRRRIRVLLAA